MHILTSIGLLLALLALALARPAPEHNAFASLQQQAPKTGQQQPKAGQQQPKSPKATTPSNDTPTTTALPPQGNKYLLLFARGTTEPGVMGASVGPKLSSAFKRKFPNSRVEGVAYPADFSGAVSGATNPKGAKGSQVMAKMARAGLAKGERVVLSGYSQGAEQVHGALMNLGPDAAKVYAAVTFGDPLKNRPQWGGLPSARAKIYCNASDGVCAGVFAITPAHLSYGSAVTDSVNFVAGLAKNG